MEKKKTKTELIYDEIERKVSASLDITEVDLNIIMGKVREYGGAKYQEGIEDAIEADVHPDIEEAMRARAEEYHEARMDPYS